ncbi:UAP56-interacting factor-like [Heterodontus francisci]|uniref:UAP56-interacting factor-like n=1 Tax=Heterodontus francisci TaxID=7792 RepID=UPI00355BBC54
MWTSDKLFPVSSSLYYYLDYSLAHTLKEKMTEFAAEPAPMEVEKSSEKIDMSLDDIIELNKRETGSTTTALSRTREQQKRQWNLGFHNPQNQLGRGVQQTVQGSNRRKRNTSGLQRHDRANQRSQTQAKNTRTRSNGMSPLNRKAAVHMDLQQIAPIRKTTQWNIRGRAQQAQKRFRPTGQGPQIPKRRIMFQNRGARQKRKQQQKQQRQTTVNINRWFPPMGARAGQKKQRTRMWRQQSTSSSILTVSVPNPQANQQAPQRRRIQHPSLNGRKNMTKAVRNQPKGVYLGFNFKSIANQTNVTLNDRFSSMKIRQCTAASRRGDRTVTLG